jgi:hypothetical protein
MGNGAAVAGLQRPDAMGRFGKFGGKYVPETLMHALTELENAFHALATDEEFQVKTTLPPPLSCLRLLVCYYSYSGGFGCLILDSFGCLIFVSRLIPFLCSLSTMQPRRVGAACIYRRKLHCFWSGTGS